jgi:Poly-adenylate binding protein, unique domain
MQVEAERLDAEAAARAANLLQRTWLALQQRREGCRHDEEQRAQEEKLIRWRLALAQEADATAAAVEAVGAVGAVEAVEAVEAVGAVGAVEAAPAVAVRSEAACCAKAWTSAEGDVAALDAMPSAMRDQQLGNALYPVVAAQLGDEALASKITGMLLEHPTAELVATFYSPEALVALLGQVR